MTPETIRRAHEVALLAAKAGEPARFAAAMTKLETLDRTGEISSTEMLSIKAIGHTRCGDLKRAAEAIMKLGGSATPAAQRVRTTLLEMPEASIARYRECIDALIPPPAQSSPAAHRRRRLGVAAAIVIAAFGAAAAAWSFWPRDQLPGLVGNIPTSSAAPRSWKPSLPPEITDGSSPAAKEYRRMTNAICKVVVRGHVLMEGGNIIKYPVFTGSGFVVSEDGLIVTNKHVVEDGPTLQTNYTDVVGWDVIAIFATEQPLVLEAKVTHMSAYVDLATIRVQHRFDSALEIAPTPVPGEAVKAFGFPGVAEDVTQALNASDLKERLRTRVQALKSGEEPDLFDWIGTKNLQLVVTSGIVSAVRDTEQGLMLQTDTAFYSGNSGGPLLDANGLVVGVTTLASTQVESTNFCVSSRTLFEELAREKGIAWPKSFTK